MHISTVQYDDEVWVGRVSGGAEDRLTGATPAFSVWAEDEATAYEDCAEWIFEKGHHNIVGRLPEFCLIYGSWTP